jgi:hypothetical protein
MTCTIAELHLDIVSVVVKMSNGGCSWKSRENGLRLHLHSLSIPFGIAVRRGADHGGVWTEDSV